MGEPHFVKQLLDRADLASGSRRVDRPIAMRMSSGVVKPDRTDHQAPMPQRTPRPFCKGAHQQILNFACRHCPADRRYRPDAQERFGKPSAIEDVEAGTPFASGPDQAERMSGSKEPDGGPE